MGRDDLLERRAGQMYAEDVRHMRSARPWESLGGDWLDEEIRKAYLRSAERERASVTVIEVSR
jgi:hypothetical protein